MYGGGSFVAMPSAYGAASYGGYGGYGGASSYMGGNVFGTQALGTTGFGTFGTSGTTMTTPMTTTAYGGYPSYGTSMGGGMNYGNPLLDAASLPMGYAGVGQSTSTAAPKAGPTKKRGVNLKKKKAKGCCC
jgi:hypothetical protein